METPERQQQKEMSNTLKRTPAVGGSSEFVPDTKKYGRTKLEESTGQEIT